MPAAEHLFAGFARTDITPPHPRGMGLYGMGRVYPGAEGVLDPICVRASYIGTRTQGFLLVALDTVFPQVIEPAQERVFAELTKATGIPRQNIWITCTHCHSSVGEGSWKSGGHYRIRTFGKYLEFALPRIIATGIAAYNKRQAAEIGYGSATVEGVASNRRVQSSSGIVLNCWANGPTPPPGLRLTDRGPIDRELGLVVFRNLRHQPIGALLNYNSHIHLYPTLNFTGELAGAVIRKLEKKIPGLLAVYTNGAEGNVSLDQYLTPQSPDPEQWDKQYLKALDRFSGRMLKAAVKAYRSLTYSSRVQMRCGQAVATLRGWENGPRGVPKRSSVIEQPLNALAIDNLALVGEQEEAFVEMALDIKAQSPFAKTFVVGFQGFRNRYFPTAIAIEEGGYESKMRYQGDAMAKAVALSGKLLQRLHREVAS